MALTIQSPCFPSKSRFSLLHTSLLHFHAKPRFSIRAQDPSTTADADASPTDEPSSAVAPPKKPTSPGLGFGSSSSSSTSNKANTSSVSSKKKQSSSSSRRERATIIRRRAPVEKPVFGSEAGEGQSKEQSRNESAFLLTWLGLGALILVEGIVLAASGLLPEEWDKFFVKYLYPSFTPTVFLFVTGTVVYGVSKYLQNEKLQGPK